MQISSVFRSNGRRPRATPPSTSPRAEGPQRHRRYRAAGLWISLLLPLAAVRGQTNPPPPFRVEAGTTQRLSGDRVFSHMVVNGTLLVAGDTTVTLRGPAITEAGVFPGQVFFVNTGGRVLGNPAAGALGVDGLRNQFTQGPGGTSGQDADPDVPESTAGDGTPGGRGYDGNDGTSGGNGWSSPTFIVRALGGGAQIMGRISLPGAAGGGAGDGSDGTQGGGGGHGGHDPDGPDGAGGAGGNGGKGGNGGQGGRGGNGGTFKLVAQGSVYLLSLGNIDASAGNGGRGGYAGQAGDGGRGGDGGRPGRGGDGAPSSQPGSGGDGGQGGVIDIFTRGDLIYTGKPRALTCNGGEGGNRGGNGGGGGHGGAGGLYRDEGEDRGPYGAGFNDPDVGGAAGHGGNGGTIRLVARGSIKPYDETSGYQLLLAAGGEDGGRPEFGGWPSTSLGTPMPPLDGLLKGGDGGAGGHIEVKAKGSVRLQARVLGGNGNFGAYGQGIEGVSAADGGPGGDGGSGGEAEVTAPVLNIDPLFDVTLTGGLAGQGGYPGNAGTAGPFGDAGPPGRAGLLGTKRLVLADPALFPQTSELRVTSLPTDRAPVGKTVRYTYRFTNDDPEAPIKDLKLLATWNSPYCEPADGDLGSARSGRGFAAFPPDLQPGQTLTWNVSARILPPYRPQVNIPLDVSVYGTLADSPGEDVAALTLPLAPMDGLWFDIVPRSSCVLPGGELAFDVLWGNTNPEDTFTGIEIQRSALPPGLTLTAGASVWSLGSLGPGAGGSASFTVRATSPWPESYGEHFALKGSATATELASALALDSVRDVWVGRLGLNVAAPTAQVEYRGNRLPSSGHLSFCGEIDPAEASVFFTTRGVDAETGAALARENSPVPLQAGFTFDTEDAARLVALENEFLATGRAAGAEALAQTVGAHSAFFRLTHEIFESSLPLLGTFGLPTSGQREALTEWKTAYPSIGEEQALRQTDAVERLKEVNALGVLATMIARQHYPEIVEGVEGIVSVYDLLYLFSAGLSKNTLLANKVLGNLLGGTAGRIATSTGLGCDILVNTAYGGIAKRLGVNRLLSGYLQGLAFEKYLAYYEKDIVKQIVVAAQWQVASGKTLNLVSRNLRSPSWAEYCGIEIPIGEYLDYEIPVDPAVDGLLEGLLRQMVEPPLHAATAYGQSQMLGLSFSGSHELALLTGRNAREVLQTLSGVSLRWGDLDAALHDYSVAARDSLMWLEVFPLPAVQQVAGKAFYVADAVGRYGAGLKLSEHAHFLQQLVAVTAAGIDGVVEGSLDAFGYPITSAGGARPLRPLGPTLTEQVLAAYDRVDAAAQGPDATALASVAEELTGLYRLLAASETLLSLRASVLVNPPPGPFADGRAVTAAARDYQYAAGDIAWPRMALLRGLHALALGPEPTVASNLTITLSRLRAAEIALDQKGAVVTAFLSGIVLPDVPALVLVESPLVTEAGANVTIAATLANVGPGAEFAGTLTLAVPPELAPALQSPATQSFSATGDVARVAWTLQPSAPGVYAEDLALLLYSREGYPLDVHPLLLEIEEGGDQAVLGPHTGGTLRTTLGSARLEVPADAFAAGRSRQGDGDFEVHLQPANAGHAPGFVRVGPSSYLVSAFASGTADAAAWTGGLSTLALSWAGQTLPAYVNPAELRILLGETPSRWVPLASTVDVAAQTVSAALPRAGWYALGWPDATAPQPPAGLSATAEAGGLRLRWSASPEADAAGYQVLVRAAPGQPVFTATSVAGAPNLQILISQQPPGSTWHYTVRTLDAAGNAGPESASIPGTRPNDPAAAFALDVQQTGGTVRLSWSADALGYRLESTPQLAGAVWTEVAEPPLAADGRFTVNVAVSAATQFFRLFKAASAD